VEGLRQAACAGCRSIFFICRRCDRGQIYCGIACRMRGRQQARARANARHQSSEEGRADHRDRQRAYMSRRRSMTDTGSVRHAWEGKVRGAGESPAPEVPHVHPSERTDGADQQREPGLGDGPLRAGHAQGAAPPGEPSAPARDADLARSAGALLRCAPARCAVCGVRGSFLRTGLSDGFGFGIDTLHYEVEIAASPAKPRRGVGRFHDVRRLRAVDGDEL